MYSSFMFIDYYLFADDITLRNYNGLFVISYFNLWPFSRLWCEKNISFVCIWFSIAFNHLSLILYNTGVIQRTSFFFHFFSLVSELDAFDHCRKKQLLISWDNNIGSSDLAFHLICKCIELVQFSHLFLVIKDFSFYQVELCHNTVHQFLQKLLQFC